MGFFNSLFGGTQSPEKQLQLGIALAKKGDLQGAITAYTTVMQINGAAPEVVASALLNRGLAHARLRQSQSARTDLEAVVHSPHAPSEMVRAAREKLRRMDIP